MSRNNAERMKKNRLTESKEETEERKKKDADRARERRRLAKGNRIIEDDPKS